MSRHKEYRTSGIKSWDVSDRPREKLLDLGPSGLTSSELLAILIGKGNVGESAVALSQRILKSVNYDIIELSKMDIAGLMQFKGIGKAKAVAIASALELGRRRQRAGSKENARITCSHDAYRYIKTYLEDLTHEEFWIFLLNRSNTITGQIAISKGGVTGTIVDPKLIFKPAIEKSASGLILSHNHPSGNLKPSRDDIRLTTKIRTAGKFLDIDVLDHIIIASSGYYSFADEKLIKQ